MQLSTLPKWQTAQTAVLVHIFAQLQHCQSASTTGMFCDAAGIGKTHAGRYYAENAANAVFLDCSQYKTLHRFLRALAAAFGLENRGRLFEVRAALIDHLRTIQNPVIILDEAGDLDEKAFLEIKSLYNALEHECGWYMMGAPALEAKMERLRVNRKLGYEEIFDRFGARYQTVSGDMNDAEKKAMHRFQASVVLQANLPKIGKADAEKLLSDTSCNLRRLRKEIIKRQTAPAA